MGVIKQDNGMWSVEVDGAIIASDMTNSKAWRVHDKAKREATSRQEDVTEWKLKKAANNE